jgi:hypothetical protein
MQPEMKVVVAVLVLVALAAGAWLMSPRSAQAPITEPSALDYETLVFLDSESLAEKGIGKAYADLGKHLRSRGVEPAPVEEVIDASGSDYRVRFRGTEFVIHSPSVAGSEENSWGLATHAFFSIVNQQLPEKGPRFYAINSGQRSPWDVPHRCASPRRSGCPEKARGLALPAYKGAPVVRSRTLGPITAPPNKALHQTRRGGAAVLVHRRPVVEARLAGERRC